MPPLETTRRTLAVFRPARAAVPDTFTLTPQLATGQTMRYRLDQHMMRNGTLGHRSSARATITVLDRLDGGWLARWTTDESQLLDADPRMKPMLHAMQRLWDGVPVDIVLDDAGRVAGLADIAAMRELTRVSVDRLLGLLMNDPALAALEAPVRSALQPMLSNDAYIAQALLKEVSILLGAMGREYCVGQPLEVRSSVPSPLGTGEIPILGRFTIRGVDARAPRASLGWLMVVDRRQAARLVSGELQESIERLTDSASAAAQGGTPVDTQGLARAATAGLDLDDRGDFDVDTATAWPVRVRHTRSISGAGSSRVDTVEFSRVVG